MRDIDAASNKKFAMFDTRYGIDYYICITSILIIFYCN